MMGNSPHKQRSKKHHRMQPATAASTLDHSKLTNWQQQPVNVFLSSKRPPCVEELHQEAELNLQSLLQGDCFAEEFEDRYLDTKVTGQTFRHSTLSQSTTLSPETPTRSTPRRLEFVYLPTNRRVSEDETTTVGVRPRETCISLPTTPDKQVAWIKAFPFPIPEERRWHQSNSIQTNIVPINVSGELFDKHASSHHSLFNTETAVNPKTTLRRRRTIIGFSHHQTQDQEERKTNAVSESTPKKTPAGNVNGVTNVEQPPVPPDSPPAKSESSHGRHPGGRAATPHPQQLPLRKTFSDLGHILQSPSSMDSANIIYSSPSCNGSKETANGQENSFNYMTPSSPIKTKQAYATDLAKCSTTSMASPGVSKSGSFKIRKDNIRTSSGISCSISTLPSQSVEQTKTEKSKSVFYPSHSVASNMNNSSTLPTSSSECTFRERSLSMPTDSGSMSSVDITYTENRRGSGDYALNYPSGSSEESTSTENVSALTEQDNLERRRSRSISLRKPKKKPSPPARSVSLIKDTSGQKLQPVATMPKDQRPKSLCIAYDSQGNSYVQTSMQGNATMPTSRSMHFNQNWNLGDCRSNDLHRTLSGSSSATGTTVIECKRVQGSSESLTSLFNSRATTPSQVSTGTDSKMSSPGKPPPGLMSPSSGYSSQSETPTAVPTSLILGHSPYQTNRVRPMVPERKSSLPAVSPIDRSPSIRQSFDLPLTPPTHLDLTSVRKSSKNKVRTSRNHSESTFSTGQNQKTSPVQPIMPMVTQSDLRSIRLRSISKSETDESLDIIDQIDELTDEAFPLPEKKTKPPVAEKPPVSRRPNSLSYRSTAVTPESPVMSPSSPGKYLRDQSSPQDAYMVIGTMRPRKHYESCETRLETPPSLDPSPPSENYFQTASSEIRSFSHSSAEEDELTKGKLYPERITLQTLTYMDKKRVKIPPPIPKKPSGIHLPVTSPPPPSQIASSSEQRLSPIVTMYSGASSFPDIIEFQKYSTEGVFHAAQPDLVSVDTFPGNHIEMKEESKCVSSKTADSIVEDDDEVFVSSRTTEDLFTVIHRSKRKLLGWKDSGDSFASRQSSVSPVKNSSSSNSDSSYGTLSISRTSSKNEDFKALLQRKGSKSSMGSRPSAAELLKTTNPLARRVMNEFAPEMEKSGNTKTLP
ncbi:NHS-like protein 2 isoform X2 [Engystomops pustulosus]|uniref:NHS-like protein 2 isoform X2 n=1 Tax=Engystomops pustulosus TaxID=76066 RepID=UPI003AFAAECB